MDWEASSLDLTSTKEVLARTAKALIRTQVSTNETQMAISIRQQEVDLSMSQQAREGVPKQAFLQQNTDIEKVSQNVNISNQNTRFEVQKLRSWLEPEQNYRQWNREQRVQTEVSQVRSQMERFIIEVGKSDNLQIIYRYRFFDQPPLILTIWVTRNFTSTFRLSLKYRFSSQYDVNCSHSTMMQHHTLDSSSVGLFIESSFFECGPLVAEWHLTWPDLFPSLEL